jgi:hypothetical protein
MSQLHHKIYKGEVIVEGDAYGEQPINIYTQAYPKFPDGFWRRKVYVKPAFGIGSVEVFEDEDN